MQEEIQMDKAAKLSQVDQKIALVDDQVTDWYQTDQRKLVLVKERLASYQAYVETYRAERAYEDE